jgi:uncharacterized protein (DUF362 family)
MAASQRNVAVEQLATAMYPTRAPFEPSEAYPEFPHASLSRVNDVYGSVRRALFDLGFDQERFGSPEWNPLGELIQPGMTVFLKPNMVAHYHPRRLDLHGIITHGSVIRPILDYVCKALAGKGRIILADCPLYFSDFYAALRKSGVQDLLTWYRAQTDIPIECFDLRVNKGVRTWLYGRWARKPVLEDPRGYSFVDLGAESCFAGIDPRGLRIAVASYKEMQKHHTAEKHEYLFPNSLLASDVVISFPKLKTHRRTGVTLALKNFMGIASLKDSLPHFRVGAPVEGGDQYISPSARKKIGTWLHDQVQSAPLMPLKFVAAVTKRILWETQRLQPFPDPVYEAMWPGNDTVWRTLYDLNRGVLYADQAGKMRTEAQRKLLVILDGVIGGEGDGPLAATPVPSGLIIAGTNCAAVDIAATTAMGFDPAKIPLVSNVFKEDSSAYPLAAGSLDSIHIIKNGAQASLDAITPPAGEGYQPHPGWADYLPKR